MNLIADEEEEEEETETENKKSEMRNVCFTSIQPEIIPLATHWTINIQWTDMLFPGLSKANSIWTSNLDRERLLQSFWTSWITIYEKQNHDTLCLCDWWCGGAVDHRCPGVPMAWQSGRQSSEVSSAELPPAGEWWAAVGAAERANNTDRNSRHFYTPQLF